MVSNGSNPVNPKNNAISWKAVSIGGVSGILLGGASTFAAMANPSDSTVETVETTEAVEEEPTENAEESTASNHTTISAHGNVANGINDDMSFNEAFAAARAEVGAGGCFVWHGNVYGTYYANEWNAMSPAQRDEFVAQSTGVDYHSTHSSSHAHNHNGPTKQELEEEEDMTVEVLGVEQVQHEDGSVSNLGVASIDGQAVYFIDIDGQDDEFDLMATDLNSNGQLDEDEITDISDMHMSVSQFQELAHSSGNGGGSGNELEDYYSSNENLPDYVNDADPVDLA